MRPACKVITSWYQVCSSDKACVLKLRLKMLVSHSEGKINYTSEVDERNEQGKRVDEERNGDGDPVC